MLNPLLYEALKKLFKTVEIVNEGQHAAIEVMPNGVDWTIPQSSEHGEQYRVNCPFCSDRKKHLYLSYLSYSRPVVHGIQLRIGRLRAQCFRSGCLRNRENYDYLEGQLGLAMALCGNGMDCCSLIPSDGEDEKPVGYSVSNELSLDGLRTWVPDWQPIDDNTDQEVLNYLVGRRVTQDDVRWLHMGWGPIKSPKSGKYLNGGKPWILFPIVNNKKLEGVQARCPDVYLTDAGIKYWFHPGCRKRMLLLNLDEARKYGVCVVTEGAFDVLSVGKPGVCTFGHTPSTTQKQLLSSFDQGLIWLPDTDVRQDLDPIAIARKQVNSWNKDNVFNKGAHVVVLPNKDAGSMSRQEVWKTILEQVSPEMQTYLLERVLPRL